MKVALLQYDSVWEDPPRNFERLAPQIAVAASAGARLIVLPEMFACGFSMATDHIAEPVLGPSTRFLQEQAKLHGVWLCGSLPELSGDDPRPANTLVLSNPAGKLERYQKLHPFSFAREHEHYRAGTEFLIIEIEGLRCCFFICYDLRFADEFWQNALFTDCFVVVANWPEKRRAHWQLLLQARAIENQAYVVGVNRVGRGGELDYAGDSAVIDPTGETLCSAASAETMLFAELDPSFVASCRARFPVLTDRR